MVLKLVSRTAPKGFYQPNLQQLDTSDIIFTTRMCSRPRTRCFSSSYINQRVSKISKFPDDTKLCHSSRHPDEVLELQEDLNRLVDWANIWQMNFNIDKCAVMHIGHNNIQHIYTMANQQLIATEEQCDLEITITRDLKWQKQTKIKCMTANRLLGFIACNFNYKSTELMLPLLQVHCLTPPGICSSVLVTTST